MPRKNLHSLTSLLLFFTGLVLVITSVVLYIMPHGRVAYWSGWKLLGLSKDQWEAIHINSGIGFLALLIIHLWLNWKPFKSYVLKPQGLITISVVGLCTIATIENIPPFSTVLSLEQKIKKSWEKKLPKAPLPHAELLTLKELCQKGGIPLKKALELLKNKGIKALPNETLKKISKHNHTSPARIYDIIKVLKTKELTNF
ncbi:MAG: DUF4405 domain-containing protein [Thermodesulfobacteria bacterium]|nr:DUF4405 domain-containing protein [Thermodesulfobacteriota bacterium]